MHKEHKDIVLLIEDNSVDSLLIQRTFRQAGSDTEFQLVGSVDEALAYLQSEAPFEDRERFPLPKAIVTDLRLPGRSGLELLAWVKQQPELAEIPVIVMTGVGNRELEHAYQLGAQFYLLKPMAADTLSEVLAVFGLVKNTEANSI